MDQLISPRVFVCHNREDKPTAERIATAVLMAGHEAFFDKWDIEPGDSLIEKISEGLSDSSYLLVLLSKHSVHSRWVKRELDIALARQLKDKHIKVIPCLLDDCDIPVFLDPVKYVDFRASFEDGLEELLSAIKLVDAVASGRLKKGEEAWIHDWAIDRSLPDTTTGIFSLKFVQLSWYGTETYSCYYFVDCVAGSDLEERLKQYPARLAFARYPFFLNVIKLQFDQIIKDTGRDFGVWLSDEHEHNVTIHLTKAETSELFLDIEMRARRLGNLGPKSTMLYIGRLWMEFIDDHVNDFLSRVPPSLRAELTRWIESNPWNGNVRLGRQFEHKY